MFLIFLGKTWAKRVWLPMRVFRGKRDGDDRRYEHFVCIWVVTSPEYSFPAIYSGLQRCWWWWWWWQVSWWWRREERVLSNLWVRQMGFVESEEKRLDGFGLYRGKLRGLLSRIGSATLDITWKKLSGKCSFQRGMVDDVIWMKLPPCPS